MSQLRPVQQSRQRTLRTYCPKYILCASVPIVLELCLIEDVKESQNGSIPEKVNLNGHKEEEKKINIFSCYNEIAHKPCIIMLENVHNDVEIFLPISN